MTDTFEHDFQSELDAVAEIVAVPSILEVNIETTGMGFAAVARVTEGRWVACKVLDGIDFGLKEGGELVVETTICHEIRASHEAVAIDYIATSSYSGHHTPLHEVGMLLSSKDLPREVARIKSDMAKDELPYDEHRGIITVKVRDHEERAVSVGSLSFTREVTTD